VGGRDLALAGGAREDEVVAVDDGGAADDGDGRCIARARIRLAPEHGDGGLGAVDGGRVVGGILARGGDLAEHRAGLERARSDGDRLAGVVAEGFPDEEAAGVRCLRPAWSWCHPFSLKVRATISPQGRAAEERPGCG
jgi:hypothetical protein